MPLQKTEAIVLKSQKIGETSKIISLYTRKYGKMKIIAKGARSLKSHFYGTLEPINYISIVFYLKENRDLQFLSQADIIESFNHIKNNLDKIFLVSVVCEIVFRSQYAEEANPYLFKILIEFLNKINTVNKKLENYFYWFQLKFLEISGFKPQLDRCILCDNKRKDNEKFYFSIIRGGYVCHVCKIDERVGLVISNNTLNFLNSLENCELENVKDIENSKQVRTESSFILNKFMAYHIEELSNLKSMEFFNNVNKI